MYRHRDPSRVRVRPRSVVRRRAATLIELLVVISMIGLLISILIPSLHQSMRLARAAVCMHNLREIGVSLTLYRIENDGWLPSVARSELDVRTVRDSSPWFVKLHPSYLPDPLVLTCPEDPYRWRMVKAAGHLDDPLVADYASYGLNSFLVTAGDGFISNLDRHQPTRPLDTILVADLGPDDAFGTVSGPVVTGGSGIFGPTRNASLLAWDDGINLPTGRGPEPWVTTRHRYGVHVLTLAGGVREARTGDVMRKPLSKYYENCAGGGCTFCNELRLTHYSFAKDHLYWWTGPVPSE